MSMTYEEELAANKEGDKKREKVMMNLAQEACVRMLGKNGHAPDVATLLAVKFELELKALVAQYNMVSEIAERV